MNEPINLHASGDSQIIPKPNTLSYNKTSASIGTRNPNSSDFVRPRETPQKASRL